MGNENRNQNPPRPGYFQHVILYTYLHVIENRVLQLIHMLHLLILLLHPRCIPLGKKHLPRNRTFSASPPEVLITFEC
jgi:hypothetical protein